MSDYTQLKKLSPPKATPTEVATAFDKVAAGSSIVGDKNYIEPKVKKGLLDTINGGGYWVRVANGKIELLMREAAEEYDGELVTEEEDGFEDVMVEEPTNFVQMAIDKKPLDFADAVQASLYNRVRDRLDAARADAGPDYFKEGAVDKGEDKTTKVKKGSKTITITDKALKDYEAKGWKMVESEDE